MNTALQVHGQIMEGSSDIVDEAYLSALHDYPELIPISDENYAEELQLQEILINSNNTNFSSSHNSSDLSVLSIPSSSRSLLPSSSSLPISTSLACVSNSSAASSSKLKTAWVDDGDQNPSSQLLSLTLCSICMDAKPPTEFINRGSCTHSFCTECISQYVATKVKENGLALIHCPDPNCKREIEYDRCREILPKPVLERWEEALVESMILGSEKFYCPFNDCSALMVFEPGIGEVGSAECPVCHRLFCAQCKVAWHHGFDCEQFQRYKESGNSDEIRNDFLVEKLAKEKEWMKCPNCSFIVEKVDGCRHITCRCKYEFCYRCGSAWSLHHESSCTP